MSEEIKQEGEFKITKKKTPRNLTKQDEIIKVDFSKKEQDITKVVIPNIEEKEDAIQKQSTDESVLRAEQSKVELQEMGEGNKGSVEDVIEEITELEEEKKEKIVYVEKQERNLPENVEKLISFMEETGGTVEDYVRLNADYSNTDETTLLKEYYKKTKPHLDKDEIEFFIEDEFVFDEEIDEEREIRKKKLAFKEEVAKAKSYLESVKSKYYDEIKLRPGVTQDQKEAYDFFNRYKKNEEESKMRHERFKQETKSLLNNDFKGFEFNVGEKRFRYSIQNVDQVADTQSDINNFVGKFLDNEGNVSDTKNYHKALYAAMNSDKIAQHFYEQGKADAIKEVVTNSKNPAASQPRQTGGEVFINGLKVKAISGMDSSKLKIQTKRFNN
jgi:hypothetical protein